MSNFKPRSSAVRTLRHRGKKYKYRYNFSATAVQLPSEPIKPTLFKKLHNWSRMRRHAGATPLKTPGYLSSYRGISRSRSSSAKSWPRRPSRWKGQRKGSGTCIGGANKRAARQGHSATKPRTFSKVARLKSPTSPSKNILSMQSDKWQDASPN